MVAIVGLLVGVKVRRMQLLAAAVRATPVTCNSWVVPLTVPMLTLDMLASRAVQSLPTARVVES